MENKLGRDITWSGAEGKRKEDGGCLFLGAEGLKRKEEKAVHIIRERKIRP